MATVAETPTPAQDFASLLARVAALEARDAFYASVDRALRAAFGYANLPYPDTTPSLPAA